MSAALSVGYAAVQEADKDYRYVFAEGVHKFDIGPEGYAELHALLADVVGGTVNRMSLETYAPGCFIRTLYGPSGELRWTGPSPGAFIVPRTCLSSRGEALAGRFDEAWRLIARNMLLRNQPGVKTDRPARPAPPEPLELEYTQRSVWTGFEVSWRIAPNGKGWLELSEGKNLQLADVQSTVRPLTVYIVAGRHPFDIGSTGYAKIRTALEPYISGPERFADCDGTTDQPMVTLSWKGGHGNKGKYQKDLGCPDLAARAQATLQAILPAFAKKRE